MDLSNFKPVFAVLRQKVTTNYEGKWSKTDFETIAEADKAHDMWQQLSSKEQLNKLSEAGWTIRSIQSSKAKHKLIMTDPTKTFKVTTVFEDGAF